jgi:hypothetical protein
MVTVDGNDFTLYAGNKGYDNGDNGTSLGFFISSSVSESLASWTDTGAPAEFSFSGIDAYVQEIRYYNVPLNENSFKDYVMNPYSIEGNSLNSGPNELIFRASLGGELYIGSSSIHPKATGSWDITQSFTSDSNFTFNSSSNALTLSGSLNVSGSTLFVGTHTLSGSNTITGNTVLSGSIEVSGSSDFKNSVFIVTGSAFFKGTHQVSGSTSVTGSFDVIDGNINIVSGSSFTRWGNKLFNYGQFSDTTIQSGSANTAYSMKFDTTDFTLNTRIVSESRITVDNTGLYNLQFSAQLGNTANSTIDFDIWFAYTGSNIPNSNTQVELTKVPGTNGRRVAAWNFAIPIQAGDYIEIKWSCNAATGQIQAAPSASTPTRPAIPSVIATLTQIA